MRNNKLFEKDEALSKLLGAWKTDAQLPPRFQEAVWQRVERAQPYAKIPLWQVLASRLEAAFCRPALASTYIAALLFAGLGAGYWHAGDKTAQANSELRARYVQTVDPYQMQRN